MAFSAEWLMRYVLVDGVAARLRDTARGPPHGPQGSRGPQRSALDFSENVKEA